MSGINRMKREEKHSRGEVACVSKHGNHKGPQEKKCSQRRKESKDRLGRG